VEASIRPQRSARLPARLDLAMCPPRPPSQPSHGLVWCLPGAEGALKTETPGPRPSDANGAYCRAVHAPGL